jgi:hypothetical protein
LKLKNQNWREPTCTFGRRREKKRKTITNNKPLIFHRHPSHHKEENMSVLSMIWWKGNFVHWNALHMLPKGLRHLLRAGIWRSRVSSFLNLKINYLMQKDQNTLYKSRIKKKTMHLNVCLMFFLMQEFVFTILKKIKRYKYSLSTVLCFFLT